jgi:hypothetical protein
MPTSAAKGDDADMRAIDDIRRNALVAIGAALMAGAIAWVPVISLAHWAWPVRVLPPLGMFGLGAALVLWAVFGEHSRGAVLKIAIREGREILRLGRERFAGNVWLDWCNKTRAGLSEHVGAVEAQGFHDAGADSGGEGLYGSARAQVAYLEGLRKRGLRRYR